MVCSSWSFSLFCLSFSIFHVDLPSHLSFSCVLSYGWACSSLLIYSFIFKSKNGDWLFFPLIVYLLVHTCFFHSDFLQVLACIFSHSAFCLLFISLLWLCPVPQLSLSPVLSCQPWVCLALFFSSSNLCCHGSPDTPMPSHFCPHSGIQFEHYCHLHHFILGSAFSITTVCRKHHNDCVVELGLNCIKQGPLTYFQNEWKVYKNHREEKWYSCS